MNKESLASRFGKKCGTIAAFTTVYIITAIKLTLPWLPTVTAVGVILRATFDTMQLGITDERLVIITLALGFIYYDVKSNLSESD